MLYSNLFYFLIVIFVVSTSGSTTQPVLPPLWTLAVVAGVVWGYGRLAWRLFAHSAPASSSYFAVEKRLSILAVLILVGFVYLLDVKYYLSPLSLGGRFPAFVDITGLALFFLLLVQLWLAGRQRYQQIFQRSYTPWAFVRTNGKANLPIVLPWLLLSLLFEGLLALPLPQLGRVLRSPWGDLAMFILFLTFLTLVFPPLVRRLWGCTPLPPSPQRDRLQAFCRRQGFYGEMYSWPLFEGQALTAGIVGIVPGLRYLMITPALLDTLQEEELDSVFAHELGHVKHRHLVLYLLLFIGLSCLVGAAARPLPYLVLSSPQFYWLLHHFSMDPENVLGVVTTIPLLMLMLLYFRFVFGWFIRNFERQADAYAFRTMGTADPLIRSFEKIALFGGSRRDEKNWHHFGLGERIDFLICCERDPSLVTRHARRLRLALVLYCLIVGLVTVYLSRIEFGPLPESYTQEFAEAMLLQKARQEPGNSLWLLYLGNLLQSRNLERKAMEAYERALVIAPDNAEINNNLAWLLLTARDQELRDPVRALTLAQTAATLQEQGFILDTLAHAYWANGLVEAAVSTELKALHRDPGNRQYYLGQLERFRQRRWQEKQDKEMVPN